MSVQHHIYWWNLENLFDVEDSAIRPEWLQSALRSELRGWNASVLDQKLTNLSRIIGQFQNGKGPDILGVCEIENKPVVSRLMEKVTDITGRQYKVMHKDTSDKRGIDIAIIYDKEKYTDDGNIFSLAIMKRNATRDLFQINLHSKAGHELILIGNHWPARSSGQYASEPFRMMVAETLGYWIDRIVEIKGKYIAYVLMGDFNDEPYNRSIVDYLRATSRKKKIENARNNYPYNPMWAFLDGGLGTYVYGSTIHVLDQFMVSRGIVSNSPWHPFTIDAVRILDYPELVAGEYNKPIRFGRPSSRLNLEGYSDHLPIELVLTERVSHA